VVSVSFGVIMNTKKVNAQGPGFFDDLHAALDRIEAEFSECAAALTVAASDAISTTE
jgi:hypothetical protein